MSKNTERDDAIDGILRGALSGNASFGGRTAACVDAEQMASWIDGGLAAPAAREVEAHLAGCPHCQMVLGTFVSTDSAAERAASPAIVPFWRRWALPWLIPATAGMVTVVLWSALRLQAPHEAPTQSARVEPADTFAQGNGGSPVVVPPPPSPMFADERAQDTNREVAPARQTAEQSAAKMAAPAAPAAPAASAVAPAETRTFSDEAADRARETTMSARTDMAASTAAANQARFSAGAAFRTASSEPPGAVLVEFGITPPLPAQTLARQEAIAEPLVLPPAAPAPAAPGGGAAGRGGAGRGVVGGIAPPPPPASTDAVSSAVPARWRIYSDGRVERLVAAISVWEPVVIAPPAAVTAGSAPSALVCWLAGRGGVVLRTTDGRTFTRVSLPVVVDVASIVATSALQARVTTVDGRVLSTTDGGMNWQ